MCFFVDLFFVSATKDEKVKTMFLKGFSLNIPKDERSYIRDIPVIKSLNNNEWFNFKKPVTFFVGENGSGKSTLLESLAISVGLNAEGGSRNFNFSTKHTESNLHNYIRVARTSYEKDSYFLRAESLYNVASNIEELRLNLDFYGGRSLHEQSHGESFMSLIENRFIGNGLYLLDEPEAALSPTKQMSLLAQIDKLVNNNSQFIIATHSPIILAYPNAEIYEITEKEIKKTAYKDTFIYKMVKQFVNSPERMIDLLLN